MRFRAKFVWLDAAWLATALFCAVLWISGPGHASTRLRLYTLFFILNVVVRTLIHFSIVWKAGPDGLNERRLWNRRTIPWSEITEVTPWPEERPIRGYLAIYFARSAPLSDRGTVIANPGNLDVFLAAIRHHAPQTSGHLIPSSEPASSLTTL